MDNYLERIASSLEKIADALAENPRNTIATLSTAADTPIVGVNVDPEPKAPAKKAVKAKKEEAAVSGVPVTLADVAEHVRKLVSDKGHPAAVSVLTAFGAKRISEVKAEDFPGVIAKVKALLAAK